MKINKALVLMSVLAMALLAFAGNSPVPPLMRTDLPRNLSAEADFAGQGPIYEGGIQRGILSIGSTGTVGYINVKDVRYAGGAKGDGREVTDAVVAATSTVTSATANFLTNAKVGQIIFGIRETTGVAVLPQGTISAINSNTSITVSTTGTGSFSSVRLRWGSDDTAALAAATTATIAVGKSLVGLGTLYLPTGFYMCNKTTAVSCIDFYTGSTGYDSLTVLGDSPNSSVIWTTPNMTLTTGGGGAQGNCLSIQAADFTVENIGCDGGLYSANAMGAMMMSFHSLGIANVLDNTPNLIMNVHVSQWHKFDADLSNCGIYVGAQKTILFNIAVEGNNCGTKLQGGADTVINSLFSNNQGYNLRLAGNGDYPVSGGNAVIKTTIDECGSTAACFDIVGVADLMVSEVTSYGFSSGIAMQVDGTSSVTISNSRITPYSTDTNSTGLKILAGGVVAATNTKFRSSGTGFGINNAGTFTDGCGNKIEVNGGTGGISNTGTFKNCFNQPLGGSCLLASAAGPLACVSAGQGKVAIPTTTTTYTVNTTAVEDNSIVEITPMTANNGIPGTPTCVVPAITSEPVISAIVAKTSFTIALASTVGITCWSWSIATP